MACLCQVRSQIRMARLLWTDMKFNNFNHCLQNGKQKNISEHTDIELDGLL